MASPYLDFDRGSWAALRVATPLTLGELAITVGIAALVFCAVEIEKMGLRNRSSMVHSIPACSA